MIMVWLVLSNNNPKSSVSSLSLFLSVGGNLEETNVTHTYQNIETNDTHKAIGQADGSKILCTQQTDERDDNESREILHHEHESRGTCQPALLLHLSPQLSQQVFFFFFFLCCLLQCRWLCCSHRHVVRPPCCMPKVSHISTRIVRSSSTTIHVKLPEQQQRVLCNFSPESPPSLLQL